jgi:hypothetical protein
MPQIQSIKGEIPLDKAGKTSVFYCEPLITRRGGQAQVKDPVSTVRWGILGLSANYISINNLFASR